jgi:Nucleotide modification associated domain 3
MRIILSRKGFDSGAGGIASPIFPSGTMCSLPIPESSPAPLKRYGEIWCGEQTLGPLVRDLTGGKLGPDDRAHLDPHLDAAALRPRPAGWRPLFGQSGAAERHLRNQGVAEGDVFLFFGWFRRVERDAMSGAYRYVEGAPDLHCLFGWLQIAECVEVQGGGVPSWAQDHPHWQDHQAAPSATINTLYVASDRLHFPGQKGNLPGGGVFRRYAEHLRLTAPGASRSVWHLPAWFHPQGRSSALSYHANPDRWQVNGQTVQVRTVGRGQEFVLDCDHYPEALEWLVQLFGTV